MFGLPSPLVLGLIAGILEFVPLVGPLVVAVWLPRSPFFSSGLASTHGAVFLGVLRIVQDYVFLSAYYRHGFTCIHSQSFSRFSRAPRSAGVAGIFLAIPVIAIITVTYRHWLEHRGSETIAEVIEEAVVDAALDGRRDDRRSASSHYYDHARRHGPRATGSAYRRIENTERRRIGA